MMPIQSVWMFRFSLVWLVIAATIGALLLVEKAVQVAPMLWGLLPVHYELAIWGWMVQFVVATAYWIFPRFLTKSGNTRGSEGLAWVVFVFLNLGVVLLTGSTLLQAGLLATAGRGLIAGGLILFSLLIWRRIVTYRNVH